MQLFAEKADLRLPDETSTGVLNPVQAIAERVGAHGALRVVDAVSFLGGPGGPDGGNTAPCSKPWRA